MIVSNDMPAGALRLPYTSAVANRGRHTVLCATLVIVGAALAGCDDRGSAIHASTIPVTASFGEVGLSPGQFSYPRCIDAGFGALWIVDKSARVQKIDPVSGRCVGGWRMPEFEFGKPTGITIAAGAGGEPLIYVADTHYHRVHIYRPNEEPFGVREPELLSSLGSYGTGDGQFVFPTDIVVLTAADMKTVERLYISEYGGNDRINVFTPGSTPNSYVFSFSFGSYGASASATQIEFSRPQSMAIDAENRELIVTDACNHRVGVFTLDGALVRWIGSADDPSDSPGRFKFPYGLQLLGDGTALVAEFGGNRVQRIDLRSGEGLAVYGSAGREGGHLASPWGVTMIGETVYALDSGNNRVVGFAAPARRSTRVSDRRGAAGS